MNDKSWTEEFFFEWPLPDWINAAHEDTQNFRRFQGKWKLGMPVGTGLRTSRDQIQVIWLFVQHQEIYIPQYVAKVIPEYTEKDALHQLRRYPPRIPKTVKEVQYELDRYINEARAYQRIEMSCTSSERIYFPEFHGVITELGKSRVTYGYINPRAVVLEAIRPKLASRRILAAYRENSCDFQNQLNNLGSLSDFEMEYYHSLFHDRVRRLLALHRLGITHGDVRDDHFRLPGDFYDTVLYDFSHSYTFSPVRPYLLNWRRPPWSLKRISNNEQARTKQQIYERAEKLDFRAHLIKSTKVTESVIINSLFEPLKDESLELIILRVRFRPDAFSMPSLNSVFPFLEDVRPENDSTWHIRRGRLLGSYESIWICSTTDSLGQTAMSFVSDMDCAQKVVGRCRYFLCLIPKEWEVEDACSLLMSICLSLPRGSRGCIKTRLDFESHT